MSTRSFPLFLSCALWATLSACGGSGAPKQFLVTVGNINRTAGLNATCPEVDARVIKTSFLESKVLTVYQGDKDHWYLAAGDQVFEGTLSGGTYTFSGQENAFQFLPSATNKQLQVQQTTTYSATLTIDGRSLSGQFTADQRAACQKVGGVITCEQANLPSKNGGVVECIASAEWTGTQLSDPEFKQVTSTVGSSPPPK